MLPPNKFRFPHPEQTSIWVGWDPREALAFAIARYTIREYLTRPIPIHGLMLESLRKEGLYYRPTSKRNGGSGGYWSMWDDISEAPMSTEFAISRFLLPELNSGWALFLDADMLARGNVARLFDEADPRYAVMVVKHVHAPTNSTKMDNQPQTAYPRKNWSSFMLFNCEHPSNKALTVDLVNSVPGRDLHRFCWLKDEEIGELHPKWNFLVGHTNNAVDPLMVHFTDGGPWFPAFENVAYADEWFKALKRWAK